MIEDTLDACLHSVICYIVSRTNIAKFSLKPAAVKNDNKYYQAITCTTKQAFQMKALISQFSRKSTT